VSMLSKKRNREVLNSNNHEKGWPRKTSKRTNLRQKRVGALNNKKQRLISVEFLPQM
jgi:hypothetical protein